MEILALRQNSGYKDSSSSNRPRYITRTTKDTVLKVSRDVTEDEEAECPSEALALQLVSEQSTIPVPQIRRVVKTTGRYSFFAMEYIPGQQLSVIWPTLSWFEHLRVAFIIRSYVQQLRKIKHPRSFVPGPLASPNKGGMVCQSPLFGPVIDCRGPFEIYADLTNFFNDRLSQILMSEGPSTSLGSLTTFDNSQPLVFCNQYLDPDNFIVGDDGRLWLVDWPFAGFIPPGLSLQRCEYRQSTTSNTCTGML